MRRFWVIAVAILLALTTVQAGATEKAAPWIDKMSKALDGSYTCSYVASVDVEQMGQKMTVEMNGTMARADETHFRGEFDMSMSSSMLPEPMKMAALLVNDGTTAWMEMNNPMLGGKQVMKIALNKLPELAEANPQARGMRDMNPASQLITMTEMFDVDLMSVSDGKVKLSAEMTKEAMGKVLGQVPASAGDVQKFTMVLEEKTGIPVEVHVGEPSVLTMRFTDFTMVDPAKHTASFDYSPPEGAQVMDLEAMMGALPGQGG